MPQERLDLIDAMTKIEPAIGVSNHLWDDDKQSLKKNGIKFSFFLHIKPFSMSTMFDDELMKKLFVQLVPSEYLGKISCTVGLEPDDRRSMSDDSTIDGNVHKRSTIDVFSYDPDSLKPMDLLVGAGNLGSKVRFIRPMLVVGPVVFVEGGPSTFVDDELYYVLHGGQVGIIRIDKQIHLDIMKWH